MNCLGDGDFGEKPYMMPLSTISTGTETFKSISSGSTNDICGKGASDMNIYISRKSA